MERLRHGDESWYNQFELEHPKQVLDLGPLASKAAHPNINYSLEEIAMTGMIWHSRCGRGSGQRAGRALAPLLARAWVLLAAGSLCNLSLAADLAAEAPNASRRGELITLVRQDCGSCHGLTLKGGLGPALLPETLRDKPADSLKATLLHGRPGTAMPPWRRFVSEAEAQWIIVNLQKGFPSGR